MLKPHHRQYVAVCLFDYAMSAALVVSPFFIFHHLGGGPAMSGIITGLQWCLYALACLVSARFVNRARNGLVYAYIGGAGFMVLFPLAPAFDNVYYFAAMSTGAMVSTGLFWPAMQAWIGAEPGRKLRMRRMSHYNVSWTIGLTLAPACAGFLYDIDYRWPFVSVFFTALVALALVATLPRERKYSTSAVETAGEADAAHKDQGEAHLYTAWFALLVGCALVTAAVAVYSKRVEELSGAGRFVAWPGASVPLTREAVWYFGWIAFAMYGARASASLVMGWTHAWEHRFWVLAAVQAAGAAACWVMGFTEDLATMLVCGFMVGAVAGVSFFASQSYSVVDSTLKHGRLAIHECMVGTGCLTGALSYGLLAEAFGTPWPFTWTPAFMTCAVLIQYGLLVYGRQRMQRVELARQRLPL